MPVFTAAHASHPHFGSCYAIDVLLPGADEATCVVLAYLSEQFQRSVVSPALAKRLNCQLGSDGAVGHVVVESRYEGGPVIHRSAPASIEFRLAHANFGDAYLHLSLTDLEPFLAANRYAPRGGEGQPFLALLPHDPDASCVVIPLDR